MSLLCNFIHDEDVRHTETKYVWNDAYTHQFRSGIIASLPLFNNIVNTLDCNSRQSVNNALNSFTDTLRNVADPLFSKNVSLRMFILLKMSHS